MNSSTSQDLKVSHLGLLKLIPNHAGPPCFTGQLRGLAGVMWWFGALQVEGKSRLWYLLAM